MQILGFAALGIVFLCFGFVCLRNYRTQFLADPYTTITWDALRSAAGAGGGWGQAAVACLCFGTFLCTIAALMFIIYLAAVLGFLG
jgi:hypothetical protein